MTKGTVRYAFLCCNFAAARSRFYSSTTACCLVSIAKCFNLMLKILKSALNPIQEFHSFTSQKLLPLSLSLCLFASLDPPPVLSLSLALVRLWFLYFALFMGFLSTRICLRRKREWALHFGEISIHFRAKNEQPYRIDWVVVVECVCMCYMR